MTHSKQSRLIGGILLASIALRWLLIFRGGQYFFSDEGRYETSRAVTNLLLKGNLHGALLQLFTAPEHLGFKIIGLLPALAEHVTRSTLILPALFFSLFPVWNLYLIYLISKQDGNIGTAADYALIFAASGMSLLYYARHLLPYDVSMTFGLLAIYFGRSANPTRKTSLLCGGLSFVCFITYNGYWPLAALAMIISSLRGGSSRTIFQKGSLTALGFFLPAILLILFAALAGINLPNEYRIFASTVSQGSFNEGWSLPFEYFWHAEHWIFAGFSLLGIYAMVSGFKEKNKVTMLWSAALIFIYLCLLIPSVLLHAFVVYGRLARQMMPFIILLAAQGLVRLENNIRLGRTLKHILFALIVTQAVWNYRDAFGFSYPREFSMLAQAKYADFHFSEKRLAFGAPALCQNNGYVIEYAKHFATPPEVNPPIQGEVLLSAPHPDNFIPYQYEGYSYEERRYIRIMKPEMRFYKANAEFMSDSNPVWKTMKSCVVKEN